MRRLFLLILAVVVVAAGPMQAKEKSPFQIYLGERTSENFLKALESYEQQRADTVDYSATVIIAYLNMLEMNRNMKMLEENLDDLSSKNKFSYANMLLSLEKYDDSIEIYKILNETTPKWSCPWRHRGEAHWKKKEYDKAVMALEKAIETRETHYDAYVMLAEVLRDMEEYGRALETLEKGLTYYGKDIEDPQEEVSDLDVHFLYLDLLEKNGRTEKAEKIRATIREMAPGDERLEK